MAKLKRTCDRCGKQRVFKNRRNWGAICKAGHFICKKCHRKSLIWFILNPFQLSFMPGKKKKCPICKEKLLAIKKTDLV